MPAPDATAGVRAMARALLAADVAVAASDPRAAPDGLMPEEAAAVAGAVDRRRREFAADRISAGIDGRIADVERFLNGRERDFSGIFDLLGIVRHVQSEPS